MATIQSTGNIIIFQANGDTARTTAKLKLAGVLIVKTALANAGFCLANGASSAYILPLGGMTKSGPALPVFIPIVGSAKEQTGLKATTCSGCKIAVFLE